MLTVSSNFKYATTDTIRFPKAKLDFIWTDIYVDPLLTTECSTENYNIVYSRDKHDTNISLQAADGISVPKYDYTILDGTWSLNGTKHLGPHTTEEVANHEIGWYSANVCDTNGNFANDPYPQLQVHYQARLVTSLYIAGHSDTEYPKDFLVYLDNDANPTYVVSGNTDRVWTRSITPRTNSTKIRLIITKWSRGNTVAKIVEFYTIEQSSFDGDTIVGLDLIEEREIRNGSSPVGNISINEIDITMQNIEVDDSINPFTPGNPNSKFVNFLKANRRVIAYYGFLRGGQTEYVKVGTYWTDDWTCKDTDYTVKVSAQDRLKFFKDVKFRGELKHNISLYDLSIYVLELAKQQIMSDIVYDIDTELQSIIIPIAYFDDMSYFEVLRRICEAACGTCYMSRDDVLIIESYKKNYDGTPVLYVTRDNILSKDQPINRDDLRNVVEVEINELSLKEEDGSTTVTIYEMEDDAEPYAITGGQSDFIVEIEYRDKPCFDQHIIFESLDDCSPYANTKSIYYSWGCRLYIDNLIGTPGTFKIKITGKVYKNVVIDKYTLPFEDDVTGQNLIKEYGRKVLVYKNPLVQSGGSYVEIANALYMSYSISRRDLTMNWRGDPSIELGDIITVNDYASNTVNYVVYKNKWDFDGGLKCTTNARRVIEPPN